MKIKIFKYDPAVDSEPYYIEHEVPYREHITALEALVYVHENYEEVAYDYSCHGRMCGRCAMTLNGKPCLMCCEPLEDKDYTIEPLKNFPVIRDLIVDKTQFDNRLSQNYVRRRIEPLNAETIDKYDPSHDADLYSMEWCTRCGCCISACPMVAAKPDQYDGPAFLVSYAFRHYDSYDQGDRLLEATAAGLFHCIECGTCHSVCPSPDIRHVDLFRELKKAAEEKGYKPSYA